MSRRSTCLALPILAWVTWASGCVLSLNDPPLPGDGDPVSGDDTAGDDDTGAGDDDTSSDDDSAADDDGPDPFADAVVSFSPGEGAGFGQEGLPEVVLGPPHGAGAAAGSTHVLSLGREGEIVLALTDIEVVDGPGADLLVFENPFTGWIETGVVAVSPDGASWFEFPCDATDAAGGFPGCSGTNPVYSHPDNAIDPTDPAVAGGDPYDLADLGLSSARFVRVRDSGANLSYGAPTGGYDLDAVAVIHGQAIP